MAAAMALAVVGCGSKDAATTTPSVVPAAGGASTTAHNMEPGGTMDASGEGDTTGSTEGSTYAIVSDAAVTQGLRDMSVHMQKVKASLAPDPAVALGHAKEMYTYWFGFEGTVRQNEKTMYLDFEDALADVKAGAEKNDVARVDKGISTFALTTLQYLKVHP